MARLVKSDLDFGSVAGIFNALGQLAKLAANGRLLSTIQPVSSSATIDANADQVDVNNTGADCTLTARGTTDHPVGTVIQFNKVATSGGHAIVFQPDSGSSVNGGSANAPFTLPGSTTNASTTTTDPAWQATRTGSTTWRVR